MFQPLTLYCWREASGGVRRMKVAPGSVSLSLSFFLSSPLPADPINPTLWRDALWVYWGGYWREVSVVLRLHSLLCRVNDSYTRWCIANRGKVGFDAFWFDWSNFHIFFFWIDLYLFDFCFYSLFFIIYILFISYLFIYIFTIYIFFLLILLIFLIFLWYLFFPSIPLFFYFLPFFLFVFSTKNIFFVAIHFFPFFSIFINIIAFHCHISFLYQYIFFFPFHIDFQNAVIHPVFTLQKTISNARHLTRKHIKHTTLVTLHRKLKHFPQHSRHFTGHSLHFTGPITLHFTSFHSTLNTSLHFTFLPSLHPFLPLMLLSRLKYFVNSHFLSKSSNFFFYLI